MEAFVLLLAAAVFGVGFMDIGSSSDDDTPPENDLAEDPVPDVPGPEPEPDPQPDPEPDPSIPIPMPIEEDFITLTQSEDIDTGAGDDTIVLSDTLTDPISARIDAGSGDDSIDLIRDDIVDDPLTSDGTRVDGANIDGGTGNDTISVFGESALISGGDGDDVLLARGGVARVEGGDGNDQLTGIIFNTDTVLFDGGAGDDTINAAQLENGSVRGGAGDDLINMAGVGSGGAGYVLQVGGDAGDDTITYSNEDTVYFPEDAQPHIAAGGDGADSFALRLTEGAQLVGAADASADVSIETLRISDFETGVDSVEVDVTPTEGGFTLANGQLSEEDGETSLVLLYESDDPAIGDREISVSFGTADVSLSDITFVGASSTFIASG